MLINKAYMQKEILNFDEMFSEIVLKEKNRPYTQVLEVNDVFANFNMLEKIVNINEKYTEEKPDTLAYIMISILLFAVIFMFDVVANYGIEVDDNIIIYIYSIVFLILSVKFLFNAYIYYRGLKKFCSKKNQDAILEKQEVEKLITQKNLKVLLRSEITTFNNFKDKTIDDLFNKNIRHNEICSILKNKLEKEIEKENFKNIKKWSENESKRNHNK